MYYHTLKHVQSHVPHSFMYQKYCLSHINEHNVPDQRDVGFFVWVTRFLCLGLSNTKILKDFIVI